MNYAIIPTANRPNEYKNVTDWCDLHGIKTITVTTSEQARAYATGITVHDTVLNISRWWNLGLKIAYAKNAEVVYVLNDDAGLPDDWADLMNKELAAGASGASGNRGAGLITGYAFALNGNDKILADEKLVWWYGDDDIQRQCEQRNGFTIVPGVSVANYFAFQTSHDKNDLIYKDKAYYRDKWRIDVSVVVATHGSDEWRDMGNAAAENAALTGAKIIRVHLDKGTVASARNAGLELVDTEYVVFLDADDDLDPDYFERALPTADVLVTPIKYPSSWRASIPMVWQHQYTPALEHDGECTAECLVDGNYIHVGAICRADAVRAVGGFKEFPVYEDWALFLAMQQNGATFGVSHNSVYLASTRANYQHRNNSMPVAERNVVHEQIVKELIK